MWDEQSFLREVRARLHCQEEQTCLMPLLGVHVPSEVGHGHPWVTTVGGDERQQWNELISSVNSSANEYVIVMKLASATLWQVIGAYSSHQLYVCCVCFLMVV